MPWIEKGGDDRPRSSSPIQKWQSIGQSVEGEYQGLRDGKFGKLMSIMTPTGEVVYGANFFLVERLERAGIKVGDQVKVEYLGKRKSASGREFGTFKVYGDDGAVPENIVRSRSPISQPEFDRLVTLIANAKGGAVANVISDTAKKTPDPVAALRVALDDLDIVSF